MIPQLQMPHIFTDNEKAKVGEYLAQHADLEKRRRDLLQELEQVEARILKTHAKYSAFLNTRNPVLTLPVEVICLIFTFAQLPKKKTSDVKDYWMKEEEEEEEKDGFPVEVVVSHVCRRWRSISLGCPMLWTSFQYEVRHPADARPLQRFDSYAERSVALPLRIWFNFLSTGASSTPVNVQLVQKALHHAHRWQRFTLYSNDLTVIHPFHLLRDLPVPMLEYLTLEPGVDANRDVLASYSAIAKMTGPSILRGGAPKLTYLMLAGLGVNLLPPLSTSQFYASSRSRSRYSQCLNSILSSSYFHSPH
jgi:hypothetical protein